MKQQVYRDWLRKLLRIFYQVRGK